MKPRLVVLLVIPAVVVLWTWGTSVNARTTLKNICRVKSQEEVTLHGLGLVTGLDGSGDGGSSLPTIRSLATMMQLMGAPLGPGGVSELKDAKNVALVVLSATVPAAGARRGDKIDCRVSALSAKSLAGGFLFSTPLTGPIPQDNPVVFALAEGPITLDDEEHTTTGRIHRGCQLLEDFSNPLAHDDTITLVVDKDYAGFQVTQEIADAINASPMAFSSGAAVLAKAVDQVHVEVSVPPEYRDHLVQFVSEILSLQLVDLQTGPRVVIRERSGIIVIDGDVEIGPVLITHKNIVVEAGGTVAANPFVAVDSQSPDNPKLKALLAALEAVRVPAEDKIELIKALHRDGKLYAELIVE